MSERRPDPPDPRASLVDSGWSEMPPAKERELPSYGDTTREALVTRVDDRIQARIAAMNFDDHTDVTEGLEPPPPPPPPSPSRPQAPAPSRPKAATPSRPPPQMPQMPPPPPPLPQMAPPPPSSPTMSSAPFAPLPELSAAPLDERTVVNTPAPPISSLPPSLPPPPSPFTPMRSATSAAPFLAPPTLGEALADKVRMGGAELPLWGVLGPAFGVTALLSALLAGYFTPPGSSAPAPGAARTATESAQSSTAAPTPPSPVAEATSTSAPASGSLVERARSGDERAIGVIEHQRPEDRGAEEALALATGKVAQAVSAVGKLRARLASDPGLAKDPKIVADLRRMAQDPDTSRDALGAMAALPGSLSADLLYDAWTSTAERSNTTELAQALLLGKDVRPKASPALAVAIDLRQAESCEDNAKILQRATDVGDKRAFAPLARLLRRNGCGPTKRDDCFACLREGDPLKRALTAVKLRREPELVRRDTH